MEYSSVVGISVANVVVSGSSVSVIGAVQVGVETSSVKTGSIIMNCVVSVGFVGISLVVYTSVATGTVGNSVDDVVVNSVDIGCSVDEVVFDEIVVTVDVDDVVDEKLSVVRDVVGDVVDFGDCVDAAVDCSVDDVVTIDVSGAEVTVVTLIVDEDASVLSSVVV